MSTSDSHDDPPPDSEPVFSREALTPRGGFMARPGLKVPPRHAVVVRGGDAPFSEAIPVARSSFPPPAPSEPEPAPTSMGMSEKVTLRAIPTARLPRISSVVFDEPPPSPRASEPPPSHVALESAPPPSDAPLVQSIPPVSSGPRSRRQGSRWTIFAAGAAGLILGLASVLATRGGAESVPVAAAASPVSEPQPVVVVSPPPVPPTPSAPATVSSTKAAAPARPAAAATVKKSIF